MSERPVRIALLGAGLIGRRHLRLIAADPDCRLTAVADPNPCAEAQAAGANAGYYADYRMLLDRERLDGAVITVPSALHAPVAAACAERGIHILLEKPATDTVENGLRLLDAVNGAGVRVQVGHYRRFDPAVEEAARIFRSGELGKPVAGSGLWLLRKHDAYYDVAWRTAPPGGGPILINLIHDIDMLRHWLGEVESVYAETSSALRALDVEDSGALLLRFAGGMWVTIAFSDCAPSPWGWERNSGDNPHTPAVAENCYRFAGDRAAFEFPNLVLWRHPSGAEGSWLQPLVREPRSTRTRTALADQLKHFREVIRGRRPRVALEDGLANLAVVEAAAESARRKMPVTPRYRQSGD